MESVKRYTAQIIGEAHAWEMVMGSDFSKVKAERRRLEVLLGERSVHIVALNEDLDRVTAERNALQLMLNDREEQNHSLEQRRYAEQQAREAAEKNADRYRWLLGNADIVHRENMLRCADLEGVENINQFIDAAINHAAEAVSHVDCGSCRNITDGCKGTCQRSEEWSKP